MNLRFSRRDAMLMGLSACVPTMGRASLAAGLAPRMRVIVDNDFGGDPDGLFQLAHHLLSPSVDIALIVGSHLPKGDALDPGDRQATNAASKAAELTAIVAPAKVPMIVAGNQHALSSNARTAAGPATAAIVAEAMRNDTRRPLFYTAGAGLTDIALAWTAEPRIGRRMILVWIGGAEYPGDADAPPGVTGLEYNIGIDPVAARIVFNESDIEIWQVPRNAYRQLLFSSAELDELRRSGRLGAYLVDQIDRVTLGPNAPFGNLGETYILGDSPLVTLTALQSSFDADPSSSSYRRATTPLLTDDGRYRANPRGRPMRIYTGIDQRLTFSDMVAKIRRHDRR